MKSNKYAKWQKKIGLILVILSFILYGGLLVIPFTPFAVKTKAVISLTLVILGEISFWGGAFILGKELIKKYKKYLNPFYWLEQNNKTK